MPRLRTSLAIAVIMAGAALLVLNWTTVLSVLALLGAVVAALLLRRHR